MTGSIDPMQDEGLPRDWLASYLSDRLDAPVRVASVRRDGVGKSRETWFLDLRVGPDEEQTQLITLRTDSPAGSACFTELRFEYEIYRRLGSTDVPIARARWYEDRPEWLLDGRELYIRDYVDGDTVVDHLHDPDSAYDELRRQVAEEHASALARVHAVDWRALELDDLMAAPPRPEDAAATAVEVLVSRMEAFRYRELPVFDAAIDWLTQHRPPVPDRIVLCKGSNGEGQEIWRHGRIVGMSDWELACLGDPASDWARCTGYVPDLPGWGQRELLNHYESISGIHVDEASVGYYRVCYLAEMVAVCHRAGHPATLGRPLPPSLAFLATEGLETVQRLLSQELAETTFGA